MSAHDFEAVKDGVKLGDEMQEFGALTRDGVEGDDAEATLLPDAEHAEPTQLPRVSQWRMGTLASWQLGYAAMMAFIMPILLPMQTQDLVGKDSKGTALGVSLAVGTVISTLVGLGVSQWSDHASTRFGKRAPFVFTSSMILAISASALAWLGDSGASGAGVYAVYACIMVVVSSSSQTAEATFRPMLPELVPNEQMGTASGWWAMTQMLGNLAGAAGTNFVIDKLGPIVVTIGLAVFLVVGTCLALFTNRERPQPTVRTSREKESLRKSLVRYLVQFFRPFIISSNFRWIFATRFLTQMGWGFINNFVYYFVQDVAPKPYHVFFFTVDKPSDAVGFFLGSVMLCAVISGYVGGFLGDRFGKKRMIYVSSVLQSLAMVGFVLYSCWPGDFTYVVCLSMLMGMGLGSFLAVDFALAVECLPSQQSRGTDLAVWGLSSTLPTAIAGPLGGLMLDNGRKLGEKMDINNLGYMAIYGSCGILLITSAIFVRFITVGNAASKRRHAGEAALDLQLGGEGEEEEDVELKAEDDPMNISYREIQ